MDKKKMTKKGTRIVKRLLAVVCCAAMVLGLVPNGIGVETVQAESYSGSVSFKDLKGDDILAAGTTINDIEHNTSIYFRPNEQADNVSEKKFEQNDGSSVSYQLPQKYEYNEGYIESTSWKICYADIGSKVIVLYPTPYEVSAISTGLTNATATLSKTSNVAYSDEVTLTVTAAENYTLSASNITVTPSGCEVGDAVASADNKTITYTLTHFTANATVTVSGSATAPEPAKKSTTTTLSAESITVTEGETWTLTAQAKAGNTDVDGATVVYYSDADCNNKLDAAPTAVGTYYARGEYYGSDSYEASNSEIITVTIKEKTPEKNYDIKASEISGDVSKPTEISAGTKILVDSKWGASLYVLSYVNAVELGYITDESVTDGDKGPYYWATDFKQNDTITIESAYTANGMNGTSGTIAITQEEKWYAIYHSGTDQLFIYTATPPKKVTAPTISDDDQPANASVKVGETATFTVTATGDELTYQWQIDKNDGKGFVDIDGATAASYTTSAVDASCNGYKYHCVVTNSAGSVITNDVTLTVTSDEPQTHKHTLVHHDAVAATTTATGTKEYWQCSGCDKYFSDADGKNEISAPEVIDKLTPSDSGSSDSGDTSSSDSSSESTSTTTSTTTAATESTTATAAATAVSSANIAEVGAGTLSVEAAIDTTAPAAAIATPASDILSILGLDGTLTVDEVNGIIAGNIDVEVILGVTNSESTMTQASRDLIKEKADAEGMTIAEYMDITLTKYVIPAGQLRESVTGTRIEKLTSGSVAITVTIPEAFKNTDASVIRTYYVLRNHDGEVSVLNGTLSTDAAEFTFVTDKFSDYVLTYKDTAVSTTTDTAAATTVATAPKTGDTTPRYLVVRTPPWQHGRSCIYQEAALAY